MSSSVWPETKDDNSKKCQKDVLAHLIFLETDYPDSIFVKFLIYYFSNEWSRVSFSFVANKGSADLKNSSMSIIPVEEVFGLKFPVFNEKQDIVGHLQFSNF